MNEKIILWHITTEKAYNYYKKKGNIHADGRYIFPELKKAYKWLSAQMKDRIGSSKYKYPVWAWYQYMNSKRKEPHLNAEGYLLKGTKGVRITFWMYNHEVLLSDFEDWHYPLNNAYFGNDKKIEETIDKLGYRTYPSEIQKEVENSWKKIFDVSKSKNKPIQATMWEIPLDRVKKVDHFIAH